MKEHRYNPLKFNHVTIDIVTKSMGFTLIEMVLVIVIIGVLAVTAMPRFLNLSDDAHIEVTRSVMGSFYSAAKIARAQWLIKEKPATITFGDGTTVNISSEGWPETSTANSQGCRDLFTTILDTSITIVNYSAGVAADDWSALRFGPACVFINQHGTIFDNTKTPFFSYFSTTGTGAGFNL